MTQHTETLQSGGHEIQVTYTRRARNGAEDDPRVMYEKACTVIRRAKRDNAISGLIQMTLAQAAIDCGQGYTGRIQRTISFNADVSAPVPERHNRPDTAPLITPAAIGDYTPRTLQSIRISISDHYRNKGKLPG